MPQMAPMNWVMLFTFFTVSLIMVMAMNYFMNVPKIEKMKSSSPMMKSKMSWK
uniref:ATP synthase F0 subunit 8 n=1 Tax=Agriocnemis exsudans TaxID=218364 RepID=Q85SD7_9ODON|nr:ATP synthase F0 subunit 8 [Agriocnemis exsudans]